MAGSNVVKSASTPKKNLSSQVNRNRLYKILQNLLRLSKVDFEPEDRRNLIFFPSDDLSKVITLIIKMGYVDNTDDYNQGKLFVHDNGSELFVAPIRARYGEAEYREDYYTISVNHGAI